MLNETVPFFGSNESRSIQEHLDCALALIAKRVIPGTRLAAYGHGDWIMFIDADEIALLRNDPEVGDVSVHFPRLGYDWRSASR